MLLGSSVKTDPAESRLKLEPSEEEVKIEISSLCDSQPEPDITIDMDAKSILEASK